MGWQGLLLLALGIRIQALSQNIEDGGNSIVHEADAKGSDQKHLVLKILFEIRTFGWLVFFRFNKLNHKKAMV